MSCVGVSWGPAEAAAPSKQRPVCFPRLLRTLPLFELRRRGRVKGEVLQVRSHAKLRTRIHFVLGSLLPLMESAAGPMASVIPFAMLCGRRRND